MKLLTAAPPNPIDSDWMHSLLNDSAPKIPTRMFGTLGQLVGKNGPLKKLCTTKGAKPEDELHLFAAYEYLKTIRNRDHHGYLINTRGGDFRLVEDLFLGPLNILLEWCPCGAIPSRQESLTHPLL